MTVKKQIKARCVVRSRLRKSAAASLAVLVLLLVAGRTAAATHDLLLGYTRIDFDDAPPDGFYTSYFEDGFEVRPWEELHEILLSTEFGDRVLIVSGLHSNLSGGVLIRHEENKVFDLRSFDVPARTIERSTKFGVLSNKIAGDWDTAKAISTVSNDITTYEFDEPWYKGVSWIGISRPPFSLYEAGRITLDNIRLFVYPRVTLFAQGSDWNYLGVGTNLGRKWKDPGFDDSSWPSGAAELGYGDGDEATVVGSGNEPENKFPTTYFRREFDVADPAALLNGTGEVLRDDGVILYLNGTEIYRDNQTGSHYSDFADRAIEGADEAAFQPFTFDPSLLVAGTNLIAAEIHQASGASPDLSFDLKLGAQVVPEPSTVVYLFSLGTVGLLVYARRRRRCGTQVDV